MIKDRNIANDAMIQVHKIMGSAGLLLTGEMFWVGDSGDAAYNAMRSKVPSDRLYTDFDACIGACTANRGDIIVLMEGYNKTVSAAADLDLDVSGIKVVFLGEGTTKAKITFDTAVTADMDVDAANITLVNPKFVAGIDSLQGPIDVNATDFTMINAEYHDATDIETIDAVIATSGATRLKIDGYKYFCGTETADLKQSHIQLNGCDDIVLKNIDIRGNFFVGNIENVTDEVLNIRMEDVYCENLNATPKPALFLDADATGSMKNVKLKIYSGTTYTSSEGKVSWDDRCEGFMGDGYAGEPLGAILGSGLEGKIDTIDTNVDSILVDTAVIGALGVGLSDLGGMSTGMKAEVNAEVDSALNTAVPDTPTANSLNDILSKLDGANTFDNTTDSLEAIADAVGVIDGFHDVPVADASGNTTIRDVVGIKTDAAINAVTTTKSLMAYTKGVLNEITVPAQNNTDNAFINDVVGQKTDTAAAGIVTSTDTLVGYIKQSINSLNALEASVYAHVLGSVVGTAMPVNFWWVDANIGASGAGTDPSIAFKTIQEAYAACSSSADDWIFIYDYSGLGATITMDLPFVHLIGNRSSKGMPYPRIKPATAVPGITFGASGDRCEIANLTIGGGDQTVPAISFPVGTSTGAYGNWIHDNVIGRDADAPCLEGIYVVSGGAAPYLLVENNRFYGSAGAGIAAAGSAIRIAGNATRCKIANNYISDVGRTATPAIWLDGAVTEPQIENNRIKTDTDTGTGSAITLGASVDDGWIAGNWASDGKDAPAQNPFVDGGSTNGWSENYSGIVAVLPA